MQIAPITMNQWDVAFWGTGEQQTSSSSFIFPFPFYRIRLKGYSGTAGKISSIGQPGSDFSTKDVDNDKCVCKCSQLTTGGKRNEALQSGSVAPPRQRVWRERAVASCDGTWCEGVGGRWWWWSGGAISHPAKSWHVQWKKSSRAS